MIKWIWYINVGVTVLALLMLVIGVSGSAEMTDVIPDYNKDNGGGSGGQGTGSGQAAGREGDSPLIMAVKGYVKRFDPPPPAPPKPPPPPKQVQKYGQLSAKPAKHDFGKVDPGAKLEAEFVLTNTGEVELEIEKITGSPNCKPGELTKKILAPGEKVSVKVAYEAPKLSGKHNHFISAILKDPAKPKVHKINLSCEVKTFVVATPKALAFKVDAKTLPSKIHLKCLQGLPFRVVGYLVDGEFVSIELDTEKKEPHHDLDFVTDMEKLKKLKKGAFTFKVDHPMVSEVTLPYTVTIPPVPPPPPPPPLPNFTADATMMIDNEGVMAWLKLRGLSQPVLFYLGEKVEGNYTITKITEGEVMVNREGYTHTLKVAKPSAAPKVTAGKTPKKPLPKPTTSRRSTPTRIRQR